MRVAELNGSYPMTALQNQPVWNRPKHDIHGIVEHIDLNGIRAEDRV